MLFSNKDSLLEKSIGLMEKREVVFSITKLLFYKSKDLLEKSPLL
jgi:hypothetical protein